MRIIGIALGNIIATILSKDFSKLNLTLNVAEELTVNRGAPSVQLASGARYDLTQLFRFGFELKYDVHERSGSVIPQIWFAFPHDVTFESWLLSRVRSQSRKFRPIRDRSRVLTDLTLALALALVITLLTGTQKFPMTVRVVRAAEFFPHRKMISISLAFARWQPRGGFGANKSRLLTWTILLNLTRRLERI